MQRQSALLLTLVVLLSFGVGATAGQQTTEEQFNRHQQAVVGINKYPSWLTVPIEITAVKIMEREIELGRSFVAEDDWIRRLSVTVKNVSELDLVGVSVSVSFDSDAEGTPWLPELDLIGGNDYSLSRELAPNDFSLKPGDSVDLSVSASAYEGHEYWLANKADLPIGINRRAQIKAEMAAFNQDRVWLRGKFMLRDPGNPNRWNRDEVEYRKMMTRLGRQGS